MALKTLSIYDRISLQQIVLARKDNVGSLDDVRVCFNVLNKIELTDADFQEFNIKQVDNQLLWQGNKDVEVDFSNREISLIQRFIKEKSDWSLDQKVFDFVKLFDVEIGSDE